MRLGISGCSLRSPSESGVLIHLPVVVALVATAASALAQQATLPQVIYTGWQSTAPVLGLVAPQGLATDASGDLFIADSKNNRVVELSAAGAQTTVLSGTVAGKALNAPSAIAVNSLGDVFVADTGNDRILKKTAATGATTVLLGTGLSSPEGVAADPYGDVYVSDTGHNRIVWVLDGEPIMLISPTTDLGGLTLNGPAGMAVNGSTLYITDPGNDRVVYGSVCVGSGCFDYLGSFTGLKAPKGVSISSAPSSGSYTPDEVFIDDTGNNRVVGEIDTGTAAWIAIPLGTGLKAPTGAVADGLGDLYFSDTANNRVEKISETPAFYHSVEVGSSSAPMKLNFYFTESTTLDATTPVQMATQGAFNLDFKNDQTGTCAVTTHAANTSCDVNVTFDPTAPGPRSGALTLMDDQGNTLSTAYLMGTGVGPQIVYDPGEQSTVLTGVADPRGLAVDGAGNLYVADMGLGQIVRVAASGGSPSVVATFENPTSLTIDGAGELYAPFSSNGVYGIYQISASGALSVFEGAGQISQVFGSVPTYLFIDDASNLYAASVNSSYVAANSLASPSFGASTSTDIYPFPYLALFTVNFAPGGVAADRSGNLYFVDSTEWLVWKVTPAGDWSRVGDGYNRPAGMALDGAGNVYVADMGNDRVVRVTPGGTQTTMGSGLSLPTAVTVDGKGNVYIADMGNSRIVKINRSRPPSLQFASTAVGKTSSDSPKEFTVENMGNAGLTFPPPASGRNASLSADFSFGTATTCPELTPSESAVTLAPGQTCHYTVSFTPTASGTISGSLAMMDSNLNGSKATQTVTLTGSATPAAVSGARPEPVPAHSAPH